MVKQRCAGTRRDHSPCEAPPHAIGPSGWCWAHDPDNAEARRAARSKGGKGKATARRLDRLVPATLRPTLDALLAAVEAVRDGTLEPGRASAMAALASAAVRCYTVAELEPRLSALEAAQDAPDGRRPA